MPSKGAKKSGKVEENHGEHDGRRRPDRQAFARFDILKHEPRQHAVRISLRSDRRHVRHEDDAFLKSVPDLAP